MKSKICRISFSILAISLILFFSESTVAERPPFKIYTTEEGLGHDRVNKIVRDSRGFLWFCTSEGLSRFDGVKFKNYKQDQGLPHREVYDLLETRDGTYLVATNGGLAVFNPNGKAYSWNVLESRLEQTGDEPPLFRTFKPQNSASFSESILTLAQDKLGRIWAGTANGFFNLKKDDTGDWHFEEFNFADIAKGTAVEYETLAPDSDGGLFVSSGKGVYRIAPDGTSKKLTNYSSDSILLAADGKIWMDTGADGFGLKVYSFENDELKLLQTFTKEDGLPDNAFFFALRQTSDGKIFLGMHDGLYEFLPAAKENEPKFHALGADKITSMEIDAGGNLWIGTELKGAWKLAQSGFTIFDEKDGFSEKDDIRSIYFDNDGNLLLAVRPNSILQSVDGKFKSVTPMNLPKRSWSWNFLDFQTADGEWWIPSEKGLLRYPKVESVADLARTPPKKIYTTGDNLPGEYIFNIFQDSKKDVWFTIVGVENSLVRWERKTEKFYYYTTDDGLPSFNGPISFAEDAHGTIWFGHYFGGLARFRNGKFDFFSVEDGLPKSMVSDLLIDSDGRLWIGTSNFGLFRIDKTDEEKPVFKNISTAEGLSSNQILCLTEDRFKQIYAGTGRGINRFDAGGNIRLFTRADGLPSNYVTRCAADKKGFLWFVSRNTLVRFMAEAQKPTVLPPVFIDKVSVGGVSQKISTLGETEIVLPDFSSDQSQIEIDYFALTFGAEENIRYQYKFDDQDWSNPTNQQTVNLNLSPGKHEFIVRAVRGDGAVSEKTAAVSFNILPPVWARWWFVLLAALLISSVILLLYRYRTANLRKINAALTEAKFAEEKLRKSREERLAELEKVRSRIATDLHDDIGASLTQIAILSEVAQAQSKNGISEPLEMITNVSNELVGTMSDIVWSINPAKDHFADLIQRMRRFASDLLSPKKIGLQFDAPEADSEIIVNSNIRREVFLIFKESVNNIVKHSEAKKVSVTIEISGDLLQLKIFDDGKGFDLNRLSTENDDFGGNGIPGMKKRAAEMNGKFEIISETNKGTTVTLILPMDSATQAGGEMKLSV